MKTAKPIPHKKNETKKTPKPQKKRHIGLWVLGSIVLLLVIFRLFLPYIVLRYANDKLKNMSEYTGHINDIDIALLRGAYVIKDIKIMKIGDDKKTTDTIPFFSSPKIDLSVEWSAIFKGSIVGEVYVDDPILNFVNGKHKNEDVKQDTADFKQLKKDLMPLTVNHFEIRNGQIHYIDKNESPKIDVAMTDIYATAKNLSNVDDSSKVLPASLVATGHAYEGDFNMRVDFDAFAGKPTFDLNAGLKNMNLVKVNDFFKAYAGVEVKQGRFGIYTEFAAKQGKFGGYVKPLLKDVKIVQGEGDFKQRLKEFAVGAGVSILKNRKTDEVATKVPIEGTFDNADVNIWRAVSLVLRNAFIDALPSSIDNTINIKKMDDTGKKTFLERVFGKKKNKDKKDKK